MSLYGILVIKQLRAYTYANIQSFVCVIAERVVHDSFDSSHKTMNNITDWVLNDMI